MSLFVPRMAHSHIWLYTIRPPAMPTVASYFVPPEVGVRLWPIKYAAIMPMLETTVYENDCPKARQHNIWLAWQIIDVQPKTEATAMQ